MICSALQAEMKSSITRHTITWTFDKAYEAGQFVNGDWWVLGPVTIDSATPGWTGVRNGSMTDPVPLDEQGYDNQNRTDTGDRRGVMGFHPGRRTRFPVTMSGIKSLISAVSLDTIIKGGSYPFLKTAAVLTIVDQVVPAGTFRPPYVAGDKPMFHTSQVQYNLMPTISVPANLYSGKSTIMERVWLDHGPRGQPGGSLHPIDNLPSYPRDSGILASDIALMALLDIPERNTYVHRLIQNGIDNYYISIKNDDAWRAFGGFGNGRKWPILFAGIMLNDSTLQNPPYIYTKDYIWKFGEDGHTYYGKPTSEYPSGKPLFGQVCVYNAGNWCTGSGDKDCRDPNGVGDACSYRTCCTSHTWVGAALAARIMGAVELWGHDAHFDYVDRWVKEGHPSETGVHWTYGSAFVKSAYDTYRNDLPPVSIVQRAKPKLISLNYLGENPAGNNTQFKFNIRQTGNATIGVYTSNGTLMEILYDGRISAGNHTLQWDNKNVQNGIYIIKAEIGKQLLMHKLIVRR